MPHFKIIISGIDNTNKCIVLK